MRDRTSGVSRKRFPARTLAGLAAVLVAWLMIGGGTAVAAAPKADLAIATAPAAGTVGLAVDVRYVLRNNGPQAVAALSFAVDILAPHGTQIISPGGGSCQVITPGEQLRCRYGFQLAAGERHALALRLKIVTAPTGCGRVALTYANDPRPVNNAANVRVTVDGKPGSCAATTSPSASPKPSRTKASASATPTAEVTEGLPADSTEAELTAAPQAGSDDIGGGTSFGSVLVIGGGVILVGLGGLLIWRMLRKDPDDYDDDATGPIYG
jgi:hypothetical protein